MSDTPNATGTTTMSDQEHEGHLLAQPSLQSMAACIAGLLIGWPVIQIVGDKGQWTLFLYVFTVWAALVLLLVFIGHAIAQSGRPDDSTTGPGQN